MNQLTPDQERTQELFCRTLLAAANADDEQVEAAVEAPFLYQRIRNEIAAQEHKTPSIAPTGLWQMWLQWRWAYGAIAVLMLAVGLWQLRPQQRAVSVAKQESPATMAAPPPLQTEAPRTAAPATQSVKRARPAVPRASRVRQIAPVRPREVTTEFIPLSYVADASNTGGHLIRVEVTPALLASLGLPLKPERNMDWIKADVVLGDDGLARAIRFVQ